MAEEKKSEEPLPVIVTAEQPPIPVVVEASAPGAAPQQVLIAAEQEPVPTTSVVVPGQAPTPVTITHEEPRPAPLPGVTVQSGQGTVLSPTTTEEEQSVTAGQRRINLIWESTQAVIALAITFAIVYTAMNGISTENLDNAFFLIVGFYFGRVNHNNQGGTGRKPQQESYTGR